MVIVTAALSSRLARVHAYENFGNEKTSLLVDRTYTITKDP